MKKLNKNSRVILYTVATLITLLLPFFGLLLFAILYFFANTKKSIIFSSIMLGVLVGFFAYNFVPAQNYDLVRHQELVKDYERADDVESFVRVYESCDREPLLQFYSFLISRFGNVDLLQFFVVTIGYSVLFFILADYRSRIGLNNLNFIIAFVLVLFGQHTLYFFSGLFNYVAINLFAFAFYLDYFHNKKVLPYIIYVCSVFIHTSMILPLMLLGLFKINKNKISKKLVFMSLIVVAAGLLFLINTRDMGGSGVGALQAMFNGYSSHNDHYRRYYDGAVLIVELVKVALIFFAYALTKNNDDTIGSVRAFIILSLPITLVLFPISIVLVRFVSLFFFISIPMLMSALNNRADNSKLFVFVCIAAALLLSSYNIKTIYPYGYKGFFIKKLPTTTTEFFVKGDLDE